jgi:endosialidase-like protein
MNPLIPKQMILPLLVAIVFACFGFLPQMQAVSPAPDGGYPNFTTAEGTKALQSLTTGSANTAVGWYSLFSNSAGSFNTAFGAATLFANTGDQNTATGAAALFSNTTGNDNTANGWEALFSNTIGSANTAVGFQALFNNTTGSGNIALGFAAGHNVTTASNVICIGAAGNDVTNSCYIGNIFGATSTNGIGVFVNSNGRLGTATSSKRFKEDIKPIDNASEALFALKPVAFRYNKDIDPAGTAQFGLVAEDVEKVNRDLVVRDKEGKPYSVRYDQVNAMLLNEFLKEHKAFVAQQHKVEELEANAAKQQKQIEELTAGLHKVSARLQVGKAAPQTVLNNR